MTFVHFKMGIGIKFVQGPHVPHVHTGLSQIFSLPVTKILGYARSLMIEYEKFLENLDRVREGIGRACEMSGRLESVKILPVTKTYSVEVVEYVVRAGLRGVGENRVQEAVEKKGLVKGDLRWELIGHLQTNKVGLALKTFDRIQTVDSEGLLLKLNSGAEVCGKVMRVLLQVNAGEDPAKYGVSCEGVDRLLEVALGLRNIRVEGLMTIPALSEDVGVAERAFNRLREKRDEMEEGFGVELGELSMGMSGDYVEAIKAGSTVVRIGSGLFGRRG